MLQGLRRDGVMPAAVPDLFRLRRLEAGVAAALGRSAEALAELDAVRREFAAIPLAAEAAITGLYEATVLLEDLRTAKVRALVRAMKPIFDSLELKSEALATYRRFVAAVEQEEATAAQARELAKAIERAGRQKGGGPEPAGQVIS